MREDHSLLVPVVPELKRMNAGSSAASSAFVERRARSTRAARRRGRALRCRPPRTIRGRTVRETAEARAHVVGDQHGARMQARQQRLLLGRRELTATGTTQPPAFRTASASTTCGTPFGAAIPMRGTPSLRATTGLAQALRRVLDEARELAVRDGARRGTARRGARAGVHEGGMRRRRRGREGARRRSFRRRAPTPAGATRGARAPAHRDGQRRGVVRAVAASATSAAAMPAAPPSRGTS